MVKIFIHSDNFSVTFNLWKYQNITSHYHIVRIYTLTHTHGSPRVDKQQHRIKCINDSNKGLEGCVLSIFTQVSKKHMEVHLTVELLLLGVGRQRRLRSWLECWTMLLVFRRVCSGSAAGLGWRLAMSFRFHVPVPLHISPTTHSPHSCSSLPFVTIATTMMRTYLQSRRWNGRENGGWQTTLASVCACGTSTRRSRSWAECARCTWRVTNLRLSYWSCIRPWLSSSVWSSRSEVSVTAIFLGSFLSCWIKAVNHQKIRSPAKAS